MYSGSRLLHLGVDVTVGDENVQSAIIVIVEEAPAETENLFCWPRDTGLFTHLVKKSFSVVAPKVIGGSLEIRNIEVELAIVVVVAQRNAHRRHDRSPRRYRHPGGKADFFESTVVLIVVEISIQAVVGHEQVRPSIVVVIRCLHGKILAFRLMDPRRFRDIAEGAVAI